MKFINILRVTTVLLASSAILASTAQAEVTPFASVCKDTCNTIINYGHSDTKARSTVIPLDELKDFWYEGRAQLDLEYLKNTVSATYTYLDNLPAVSQNEYAVAITDIANVATNSGEAPFDQYADELGAYGITGISMNMATKVMDWLKTNQPQTYENIWSLSATNCDDGDFECNLIYSVPFNLAVAYEALYLNCPSYSSLSHILRGAVYSTIFREGNPQDAVIFTNILNGGNM